MAATKKVAQRSRSRKFDVTEKLADDPHLAIVPRRGVVTLNGYGIQVRVNSGHLILEDGVGGARRHASFSRVGHGLKRLVVIGIEGMVSLAALRWLADQDAAFVMLERDGKVLTTAGPSRTPNAQVHRTQGRALESGVGLLISQKLISQKLKGQEDVARYRLRDPSVADIIGEFRAKLPAAQTFEAIRLIESRAGAAYWSAWKNVGIDFLPKDIPQVPAHWLKFGGRVSPLSGSSPRRAANPANAVLNYLYAVLESEARLAATALGLDPTLGFLHVDRNHRDNLALDLMEPVRPIVDAFVVEWLSRELLSRNWFFEQRDGSCRLMTELASRLSETAEQWRAALAPVAESVNRSLWHASKNRQKEPPSHLTQYHRREANAVPLLTHPTIQGKARHICKKCGVAVAPRKSFCAACARVYSTENVVAAGKIARQRSHSPEAEARRAASARNNAIARLSWNPSTLPAWITQDFYAKKVLPLLAITPVASIVTATGLTRSSAAAIRLGKLIPHPRHWKSLVATVGIYV